MNGLINKEWENIKNTIMRVAEVCSNTKGRRCGGVMRYRRRLNKRKGHSRSDRNPEAKTKKMNTNPLKERLRRQ